MVRRRYKRKASVFEDLIALPWQVSATLMVGSYVGMTYIPQLVDTQSMFGKALATAAPSFAPLVGLMFLAATALSAISAFKSKKRNQPNIGSRSFRKQKTNRRKPLNPEIADQC